MGIKSSIRGGAKAGYGYNAHHLGERIGTYQGAVGNTHFFSAESTGGDSTDSLTATGMWNNGVVGSKYSVPSGNIGHARAVD